MKVLTKTTALAVTALAFSAVAFAATPSWPAFEQVDKDKSGVLDTKEAGGIKGLDFKAVDANRDGKISKPEYEASMLKGGQSGGTTGSQGYVR